MRRLEAAPVGLIRAGGGFGKSILATEFREHLGRASAVSVLDRETTEPDALVGALRRGLRRAGLTDSAAALTGSGADDVRTALDRGAPGMLLVVEEAQHAAGRAAGVLADLAGDLGAGRMLLVGRRLDRQLDALAGGDETVDLDAGDLAFDDAELRSLLEVATGAPAGDGEVAEVRRLTFGWPAASALAAAWLARDPGAPLRPAAAGRAPLAGLVDELLAALAEPDRARVSRLGHLPLLSVEVAEACAGEGAFDLLSEMGMPTRATASGWLELSDPVRDELAARAPLPRESARAAAAAYARAGELPTAVVLLGRAPDAAGLAALIAATRWQDLAALDLSELRAVLTTMGEEALAAHPFARVQVARLAEQKLDFDLSADLLARALPTVPEGEPRREVMAEAVAVRAMVDPADGIESEAAEILAECGGGEQRARARALTALGRVAAWEGDPASMLRAEGWLGEAAALCRLAGEVEWEARTLTGLGYRVSFARGDFDAAIRQMGDALALLPAPGRERAAVATFLAEAMAFVGRIDEAEATLGEAAAIGRRLGDHRVQAYAAWTGMTAASLRADQSAVLQRVRTVELHPGGWYEHPTGIEFLADACLALARTGDREGAADYADRATARAAAAGHPEIGWVAAGAVGARWGDPDAAGEALVAFAASPQQAARDEWRTLLFRALAASRGGRSDAGSLAAQAYESAAELGRPDLPELHEPDVAAVVGPLALAAGSRAARPRAERTFRITLLGGFGVAAGTRPLEPPAGRPSTLVKLLALADGPLPASRVIEELWPGVAETRGQSRLRNLLNRLRTACGDLVLRQGGSLVLAPCELDARAFEGAAARAIGAPPQERPGLARTALARHSGELLPDDRYEPWAATARERVRRRFLALLDLLAEDAVERGDVDEAIRLLDEAQAAEPLDEDRYLRAAELLLFQGRRGSARALVERAAAVAAELGLEESSRLGRLRAATGGL